LAECGDRAPVHSVNPDRRDRSIGEGILRSPQSPWHACCSAAAQKPVHMLAGLARVFHQEPWLTGNSWKTASAESSLSFAGR